MDFKKVWPTAALSIAAFTAMLNADQQNKYRDKQPMRCDRPSICGPDLATAVTPPARPFTDDACCCDSGEFTIQVAGFYWQATEDGLEYGIQSQVTAPTDDAATGNAASLINASFQTPNFRWKPGFKVGIGYNTTHDGWDLELIWTHFNGKGKSSVDNSGDENMTFTPTLSAFAPATGDADGTILFASQANASWRLNLNLVDLELGREFWLSKMLTMRPHVGFRVAQVNQKYNVNYFGGIYSLITPIVNDIVEIKNHFTGGGVRAGLDTVWNFGCCNPCSGNWGLFGNFAASLIYGKFKVDQDEYTQEPTPPDFPTTQVMEVSNNFRSIRGIVDLAVGIQWMSMYSDSKYGMLWQLAWEFHQFFNQNQFYKVNRIGDAGTAVHGENVFAQTRGDLSTQGVTLTVKFTF